MISWVRLARQAEKVLEDNSPTILSGIAVAGTLTVAYLSGRASFKASKLIEEETKLRIVDTRPEMETKEKILLVWKEYIAPASTVAVTITCIVCAQRIGAGRTAAMAAAYKISDKAITDYKEKVKEKLGKTKEQQIHDETMQAGVDRNPPTDKDLVLIGNDTDVLCYDSYSGRYFHSSMEDIKHAENAINYRILHDGFASLGDFFSMLGLSETKFSQDIGWNTDYLLELTYTTTLADGGRPCLVLDYKVTPSRGYSNFR